MSLSLGNIRVMRPRSVDCARCRPVRELRSLLYRPACAALNATRFQSNTASSPFEFFKAGKFREHVALLRAVPELEMTNPSSERRTRRTHRVVCRFRVTFDASSCKGMGSLVLAVTGGERTDGIEICMSTYSFSCLFVTIVCFSRANCTSGSHTFGHHIFRDPPTGRREHRCLFWFSPT